MKIYVIYVHCKEMAQQLSKKKLYIFSINVARARMNK